MIDDLNIILGTFLIGLLSGLIDHILTKQNITLERIIDIFCAIFICIVLTFLGSLIEAYGYLFGILFFLLINEKLPHINNKIKKVVKK